MSQDLKPTLLHEANEALTNARYTLTKPELKEPDVKEALAYSTVATAKLNSLRLLMAGVTPPKQGE